MSLQELVGPSIHLKLSIREGHGFGFLKRPIVIVAGTNGIYLETEVVPPSPDPIFLIDLVWETDKKNLRRFRASNTPIKLECFTVEPNNQRESIGSILLNIKSAQVLAGSTQVNEKWHRLIGVPAEAKALQPELLLSLTIQEPNSLCPSSMLSQPLSLNSSESRKEAIGPVTSMTNHNTRSVSTMPNPSFLQHLSSLPSPNFKQGYIQLGPENTCMDTFTLIISVRNIFEMELLLPSGQKPPSHGKTFQITFTMMGQSLATKPFGEKALKRVSQVNEEVVLPLRTSLSVLHSYLQENPSATVCVLNRGLEVAAAELHLRSLVPTNDVQSFSREFGGESVFTQNCSLVSSNSGSIPTQNGRQPRIEVMTKFVLKASPLASSNKIPSVPDHTKPGIDSTSQLHIRGQDVDDQSSNSESHHSQDTFVVTSQSGPVWVPVAPGLMQSPLPANKTNAENLSTVEEDKKKNANSNVNVTLNSVRFYCLPITPRIRFVFESPNSSITTSAYSDLDVTDSQGPIILKDMFAKVLFKSLDSIYVHVFEVRPHSNISQHFATARICVDDGNLQTKGESCVSLALKGSTSGQNIGILHATLTVEDFSNVPLTKIGDCKNFPEISPICVASTSREQSQIKSELNKRELLCEVTPKPSSVDDRLSILDSTPRLIPVIGNTRNEVHGIAAASVLQCNPLKAGPQDTTLFPSQSVVTSSVPFDSKTAERIVEELEDWKEKQQEIFIAELKKKEAEHIARITEEWTNQTKAQNTELDHRMTECKALADSLSNAKQDLRDRLKTCAMKEQGLRKAKEELDHQYNVKFQDLSLAAQKLDEGFKLKVLSVESNSSKLQEKIKELESENESLRQQLRQKPLTYTPHGDGQMCGLNHGQVSQLLAQVDQLEGKLHASLQSKAYFKEQWGRAVREMNQAKHQFAQNADNRNGLENLLCKEEEELQNDQRTLEDLRQELANFKSH